MSQFSFETKFAALDFPQTTVISDCQLKYDQQATLIVSKT